MYFWRIDRLKARLAKGPLTDREALPYLIAYTVAFALLFLVPAPDPNWWDVLEGLSGVFYSALGTIYVYRRNGGSGGSHFLQRFFALGWVTTLRVGALFSAVVFVVYTVVRIIAGLAEQTSGYDVILSLVFQTLIYLRMGHHIEEVHRRHPISDL